MIRPLISAGLDLIYPPAAWDDGARTQSAGLSAEGWSRITFIEEPCCDGCGAPYDFDTGDLCTACQARPRAFSRARAACLYDEASRDLILQFKHADRTDLAGLFAAWISRSADGLIRECDAVAPVPLHRTRLFRRRYNQAAEIARVLAARRGLTYLPDVLVRKRATGTQGGKSGGARRRNVAGAFAVRPSAASRVSQRRVLLIDDVLTTGATAEGCARALLGAGAQCVALAVIARVKEAANLTI